MRNFFAIVQRATPLSRIVVWPLLILAICAALLELGVWTQREAFTGPFKPDPFAAVGRGGAGLSVDVAGMSFLKCCLAVRSDNSKSPRQSDLRLWIDGIEIGPPHVVHDDIRFRRNSGFSFWDGTVVFALPANVPNDSRTVVTVEYGLQPARNLALILTLLTTAFACVAYGKTAPRYTPGLLRATQTITQVGFAAAIVGSAIFLSSTLYALVAGWALPTTAIISWSSIARWLASQEPYFGHVLLIIGMIGVVLTALGAPPDRRVGPQVSRWLLPMFLAVVVSMLLFSQSAMWAGVIRSGDFHGANIGGLVGFNDSGGHIAAAYDEVRDGIWSSFAPRRPFAAAMRSVLLFVSGSSLAAMLALQTIMLSAALCFATWSVARWRGQWCALLFLGLTYTYVHTFASLSLTEALGLLWALVTIPFLIEALRTRSAMLAVLAFTLLLCGLMTRMGSMFTIPAVLLWIIICFGQTIPQRIKVGAFAVAALLCVLAVNTTLQRTYGTPDRIAGNNFAFTLCGLTIGTTWDGCLAKMAEAGATPQNETESIARHYAMAWDNFKRQPSVFFKRVAAGEWEFIREIPRLSLRGYFIDINREPAWFPTIIFYAIFVIAAIFVFRVDRKEAAFWILFWTSVVSSAGIVYFDDGRRVMSVTYPIVFLFIAIVMSSPIWSRTGSAVSADPRMPRWALGVLAAAAISMLVVPWLAYAMRPTLLAEAKAAAPSEATVLGGRRLTGFLILPDNAPLRHDVPSLHVSNFNQIIARSEIEVYQGLVNPELPSLPFAFVFAPRADTTSSDLSFIVPPRVLEQKEVSAWRFKYRSWQRKPSAGEYWVYVDDAVPIADPRR